MAHQRNRFVQQIALKKLTFFRVLLVQGARQTGKSYFVRELLTQKLKNIKYYSFDQQKIRQAANNNPSVFLQKQKNQIIAIDEAQKVPIIFDEIKSIVDENPKPSQFILLGSTEFSHKTLIKESLTGRSGAIRIFPMTFKEKLGEVHKNEWNSNFSFLHYLPNGGLPGICFVRDKSNRQSLVEDWINTTCHRDIYQFKKLKLDPELTQNLLREICLSPEPATIAYLSKLTKVSSRKIKTHLEALMDLFVIIKISIHSTATLKKDIYLPFDCAVADFYGARKQRLLEISLYNERAAYNSYFENLKSKWYYYRSLGKNYIPLIEEKKDQIIAYGVFESEHINLTQLNIFDSFKEKNKTKKPKVILFGPFDKVTQIGKYSIHPWFMMGSRV